ncbi:MAG: glycosyltransferase family 39 protein [Planctomycetes bacterium]|nr:glycosyltransferase family 39 protein [Planctomycetota bacterium]
MLSAILVLGAVLRLSNLAVHSFWVDEGETVAIATAPDFLRALEQTRHPPLAFAAFRIWMHVFGEDDATLRLLPALVSCISLLLFLRLARIWLRSPGRIFAAALYAVSSFHIWHAHEVRGYAFLELAALITLLGAASCIQRGRASAPRLAIIFVGTALAVGLHYLGGLLFLTVALLAAAAAGMGRISRGAGLVVAAASAAGMVGWAPWFAALIPAQLDAPFGYQNQLSLRALVELPVRHLLTALSVLPEAATGWVYLLGAGLLIGFAAHLGSLVLGLVRPARMASEGWWPAIAFAAPLAGAIVAMAVAPASFTPKYLMVAAPGSVLMIAAGFAALKPQRLGILLAGASGLGILAITVDQNGRNFREDFRHACGELAARWLPGDPVLVVTGTPDRFSEGAVRHYLRDRDDIRNAVVPASRFFAEPEAGSRVPGRLHVIYRDAMYARPYLRQLESVYRVVHREPMRFGVQYLLFRAAPAEKNAPGAFLR